MMAGLGEFFARLNRRIQPDPMVLACLLTLFVAALAMLLPQEQALRDTPLTQRPLAVGRIWFTALWNPGFLTFALQMCVVLLTGFGLAKAPLATRLLGWLAGGVRTNRGAVCLVALVSCVGCWINWGFGLIAGGLLATQVRRTLNQRGAPCNAAMIVAAAYCGMMIWHGGLSGSAPLKVAGEGVVIQVDGAAHQVEPIPVSRTVLSPVNLGLTLALFLLLPPVAGMMAGRGRDETAAPDPEALPPPDAAADGHSGLAAALNRSRIVPLLLAVGLGIAVLDQVSSKGAGAVNLNFVNSVFLVLGLALHRNLLEYVAAVAEGGRAITGIVLQFPLYSGIQGIMAGTGLAAAISTGFVDASAWAAELGVAAEATFPLATFLSAGIVNFFVPSGGGQWIVQGPIMCTAGSNLGLPIEQTIMAISYGDQWTNMVQPFWAIPLIGLTGVNTREFMGYCALLMLLAAPLFFVALLLM